jgi:hypothetical protein
MKIFYVYTDTHAKMMNDYFLPSLPLDLSPHPLKVEQSSISGDYESKGFFDTCLQKMIYLRDTLKAMDAGEVFIFSDVDIRFYPGGESISAEIQLCMSGHTDERPVFAFQDDGPGGCCTGFFAVRACPVALAIVEEVILCMRETGLMDQDAFRAVLESHPEVRRVMLPPRYWTIGQTGKHWAPGEPVDPPADLRMHHANWTVGVENKIALIKAVRGKMESRKGGFARPSVARGESGPEVMKPKHFIERHPLGATAAVKEAVDAAVRQFKQVHHPMPLALVLQFWRGDVEQACLLARLLADIEPEFRDDVRFVFARQHGTPTDAAYNDTRTYVSRKFPTSEIETAVDDNKRYPGVCFEPWASACFKLSDQYHRGVFHHHSAFFFEADGCPLRRTWIQDLKEAHEENLWQGKRVTGPRMANDRHVNGTMIMHLSCWEDHPSLHRCPPTAAWDIFHGQVLMSELGPAQPIENLYGMQSMGESVFRTLGHRYAWITSGKDGCDQHWARRCLVGEP